MQGYFKARNNDVVVFDAFYRENPCGGGYAIACGLEQVIDYIKNLQFSADDIRYLQSLNMFDEDFLKYLSSFRFSGSIQHLSYFLGQISQVSAVHPDTIIVQFYTGIFHLLEYADGIWNTGF